MQEKGKAEKKEKRGQKKQAMEKRGREKSKNMLHPLEMLYPKPLKNLTSHLQEHIRQRLWLKILIAMLSGVGVGLFLGPSVGLVDIEIAMVVGSWLALISTPPEYSKPLLDILNAIQEVCMTVVRWAMLLAPLAVFGLLAQTTINTGIEALLGMMVYVITVIAGLALLLLFYLTVVFLVSRA